MYLGPKKQAQDELRFAVAFEKCICQQKKGHRDKERHSIRYGRQKQKSMYEMRVGIRTKQPGRVQDQKRKMLQVRDNGTFLEDFNNFLKSANFRESGRSIYNEVD